TEADAAAAEKAAAMYRGLRGDLLTMGLTSEKISESFQQSFTSAFTQIDQGFKGMLEGFTLSFLKALDEMATAAVAKKLADLIFSSSGSGGVWNWIIGTISSAFGAGVGGGASSGGGGGGNVGHL